MENPKANTDQSLHIRTVYKDGRVSALVTWEDGTWQVMIFANAQHAVQFARRNQMEVSDARNNEA